MWFNLARLQQMKAEGRAEAHCAECYEQVPIDALVGELGIALSPAPAASDRDDLGAIHAKLDGIETLIAEQGAATRIHVSAESDLAAARLRSQLEEQTERLLRFFADEAVDGPRLFTVERADSGPRLRGFAQHRLRVVLWCEHSHLPVHLLDRDPEVGVYEIDLDREWLVKARPWIALAARVLRLGVDVGSDILRLRFDDSEWKALEDRLRLAETTLKELTATASGLADDSPVHNDLGFGEPARGRLRALHALLNEKDPDFAGLRRVRDRNRFLWVHRDFAHHYDRS